LFSEKAKPVNVVIALFTYIRFPESSINMGNITKLVEVWLNVQTVLIAFNKTANSVMKIPKIYRFMTIDKFVESKKYMAIGSLTIFFSSKPSTELIVKSFNC